MKDFEKDKNLREQVKLGIKDSIELNHLKKFNKKMNLLRYTIFSILFIIAIVLLVLFIRYNKVNTIINKAYNHIEEISNSNNYILTCKIYDSNYKSNLTFEAEYKYFYKDGKYKLDKHITDNDSYKETSQSNTTYYTDNSSEEITILHNFKTIDLRNHIYEHKKGDSFNNFSVIPNYARLKGFKNIIKLIIDVRTDYFNNEECYVLRTSDSSDGYYEMWISKENYFITRQIEAYDSYYREYTYSLVFDKVTDEDVDTSNLSEIYSDYDIKLGEQN